MNLWPSRRQWNEWSLPSRAGYVSLAAGLVAIVVSAVVWLLPLMGRQPPDVALSIGFGSKPYLVSTLVGGRIQLSYEVTVTNSGRGSARHITYDSLTQTLLAPDGTTIAVVSMTGARPPDRLGEKEHFAQLFIVNANVAFTQEFQNQIERDVQDGKASVLLEIKIGYQNGERGERRFTFERIKVYSDRVERLDSR